MASTLQQIVPDKPSRYGSGIKAIEKENLSKTLKVARVNAADGNLYVWKQFYKTFFYYLYL